jgi:hypothetical protein
MRYFEHIGNKSTHERRVHAMQVAGVFTALLFAAWAATLGARLAALGAQSSQTAAAANQNQTSLEVATTSGYTY